MPRKNKRKFFGGKSNKSKTVKLSEEQDDQNAQVDIKKQQSNESDTEENNAEGEFQLRKSAVHSSISSVSNDSTVSTPETNATKMGAKFSSSPRWCSEPNLTANNNSLRQQRATIQLKIIQFTGNTSATEISEAVKEEENLHEDENVFHAAGAVPKLDHYKEDEANEPQQQKQQRFDDNYRVESPNQISSLSHDLIGIDDENNDKEDECRNKRHAMLIQEISESSSSEEVKKYLDNEASAIEMKMIEKIDSIKPYRVESPASSDENSNKLSSQTDDNNLAQTVHEICESSSSESVKNDEKTKIATLNLKIINIQELPTENNNKTSTLSSSSPSPKAKIKLFECKSEKKLNKAEEAIIEALYGNSNLLQIPNTPLDVISEEGSDCCSDIDATTTKLQHHKTTTYENDIEDDDDVFLKSSTTTIAQRYRRNKKIAAIEEQPLLINTKLIETEINVPESCKKWETRQSDSELQAELVYLPSTSSSATDLSERSTDTEEVEEETSEDTETNSLLENITVPPLTLDITTIPTFS
ncbi:hypothetical protein PVAND_017714 [Polypedilum vanderplanki]|uniref:Uncharacterized protein n=2 Tax=Polypedilum vanderplanki TaxID=319348 RepID=A0A9J6B938_POLVA|nr:hypothetical protein PVAND_017714 [Polypedilum vanderplanki]